MLGISQEVGGDGAAVVAGEAFADVVAGGAEFGAVEAFGVLQQFLHALGIGGEHAADIGFRVVGLGASHFSILNGAAWVLYRCRTIADSCSKREA